MKFAALKSDDLLFLSGGGILGHPDGPTAGVQSIRDAWEAARDGIALAEAPIEHMAELILAQL